MLSTLHLPYFELGFSIRDFDKEVMMEPSSHTFPSHSVATMGKISTSNGNASISDNHAGQGLAMAKAASHQDAPKERTMDPFESGYIMSQKLNARPRGTNHGTASLPIAGTSSRSDVHVPDKATSYTTVSGPPTNKRRRRRRGTGTALSKDSQQQMLDELGPYDVICGRSSMAYNNIGNRRFRVTINLNLERYIAAPSRHAKSQVIREVSDMLVSQVGMRFLKVKETTSPRSSSSAKANNGKKGKSSGKKQKQKQYELIELHGKDIHNKVSHALRDLVMSQRNSQQAMLKVAMPPGGALPSHTTTPTNRISTNYEDDPHEASLVSSSRPSSTSMEEIPQDDDCIPSPRHSFDDERNDDDYSSFDWHGPLRFQSKRKGS